MLVLDSTDFWSTPERDWPAVTSFLGSQTKRSRSNATTPDRAPQWATTSGRTLDAHYAPFDERLAQWWGRRPVVAAMSDQHAPPT